MSAPLELVRRAPAEQSAPRGDHEVIALMVEEGAKALDVGCGDGALISLLQRERGARVYGLEQDRAKAQACVARVPAETGKPPQFARKRLRSGAPSGIGASAIAVTVRTCR